MNEMVEYAFITSNENKFNETLAILQPIPIKRIDMELDEIQGTVQEIVKHKVQQCVSKIKDVHYLVEDTSLEIVSLKGLPGPYIKHFIKALSLNQIYEMFKTDSSVDAVTVFGIPDPNNSENVLLFEGRVCGKLVVPRGNNGFGWDSIFQPDGYDQTYAELNAETKNNISQRHVALMKFKSFVNTQNKNQ